MHDHYELLYLVRGKINYTIESETKPLNPGEVILIAPGMLQELQYISKKLQWKMFIL